MDAHREFSDQALHHVPRLHRLSRRLTGGSADATDLVQESLCRAWARWPQCDHQQSLGAYLSRTLVNTFISRYRRSRVAQRVQERPDLVRHLFDADRMEAAADPETRWNEATLSDEAVAALEALPQHYRAVVQRVDVDGMAYQEAAEELGVPVGTIMSRLHRARRLLREPLRALALSHGLVASPA